MEYLCNCNKSFKTRRSLNSHARFCKEYKKVKKKKSKYKKGDKYFCECGKEFINHQALNGHFNHCIIHNPENENNKVNYLKGNEGWSKGLTKETSDSVKNMAETFTNRIKEGLLIPGMLGKKHTKESRQKMSFSSKESNNGYIKTSWYSIYCPYLEKEIKVQGKWELKYANYLNENKIKWSRGRIRMEYKLFKEDIIHYYHPDFYLVDEDTYIEIKGYWWKSKDGRVDDKRKMNCIIEQNEDKKIKIITDIDFIDNMHQ